jgi:hypothetical protein
MASKHKGLCRLCGDYKELSFEHIPPRKAFNEHQRVFRTAQDHLSGWPYSKYRKGLGQYSLCVECNNLTGSWYGEAFVAWTRQGFEWFDKVKGERTLNLPYYIKPLNVLKQAIVMALALSPESSIGPNLELRRFVLRPRQKYLPGDMRVFVYFCMDGEVRFASGMAILDTAGGGSDFVMAEVALPPFGYCITSPIGDRKSLAEEKGLFDISWFSRFGYNEWTQVHLRVPTRSAAMPFPLDYRNKHGEEKLS